MKDDELYSSKCHGLRIALWCLVNFNKPPSPDHTHVCTQDARVDHRCKCHCGAVMED